MQETKLQHERKKRKKEQSSRKESNARKLRREGEGFWENLHFVLYFFPKKKGLRTARAHKSRERKNARTVR